MSTNYIDIYYLETYTPSLSMLSVYYTETQHTPSPCLYQCTHYRWYNYTTHMPPLYYTQPNAGYSS